MIAIVGILTIATGILFTLLAFPDRLFTLNVIEPAHGPWSSSVPGGGGIRKADFVTSISIELKNVIHVMDGILGSQPAPRFWPEG